MAQSSFAQILQGIVGTSCFNVQSRKSYHPVDGGSTFIPKSCKMSARIYGVINQYAEMLVSVRAVKNFKRFHIAVVVACVPGVTTHCGYIFHRPVAGFSHLVFEVS